MSQNYLNQNEIPLAARLRGWTWLLRGLARAISTSPLALRGARRLGARLAAIFALLLGVAGAFALQAPSAAAATSASSTTESGWVERTPGIEVPATEALPARAPLAKLVRKRPIGAAPSLREAVRGLGEGGASYYADALAGRPTASGQPYRPEVLTAAHRTLPFGSRVRVTHLATGRSVVVRINDRGPFARDRVIDLSRAAAREIGLLRQGHAKVELELLK